jgi:hypothetical protein
MQGIPMPARKRKCTQTNVASKDSRKLNSCNISSHQTIVQCLEDAEPQVSISIFGLVLGPPAYHVTLLSLAHSRAMKEHHWIVYHHVSYLASFQN